jgi:SAM-dependent methyltransferase
MKSWFESWFDSDYYHRLYFDRDQEEAARFIGNLFDYLKPEPARFMLDIACGKGRHSLTMAKYGHYVTGIDISANSIAYARQFENDHVEFYQHDMRLPFRINYFHYAFNLFTSFGYFRTQREHDDTLRTTMQSLKPGGIFVLDYLNSHCVAAKLIPEEIKEVEETRYHIKRWIKDGYFFKEIQVTDPQLKEPLFHTEQVAAFVLSDFEKMFAKQGLKMEAVFGDYSLQNFDEKSSKRLIMVVKK